MRIETWKCDNPECGKLQAQDSNHWWVVSRIKDTRSLLIKPLEDYLAAADFMDTVGTQTLCGRGCVQKVVERFMAEVTG